MKRTGLIPVLATALLVSACGAETDTGDAAANSPPAELSTVATETDTAEGSETAAETAEPDNRGRPAEDFLYSSNETADVYGIQAEGIGCFIKFVPEGQQGSDLFTCDIEFSDPPLTPSTEQMTFGEPMNSVSDHAGSDGFRPATTVGGEPIEQVTLEPGETTRLGDYDITVSRDGTFWAGIDDHWMEYSDGELRTDTWSRSNSHEAPYGAVCSTEAGPAGGAAQTQLVAATDGVDCDAASGIYRTWMDQLQNGSPGQYGNGAMVSGDGWSCGRQLPPEGRPAADAAFGCTSDEGWSFVMV